MNKLEKMAAKDAAAWAYAEMFFGEGAGTRRKLLSAQMSSKADRIPGYADLVDKHYANQDMAAIAIKAAKERKMLDRKASLGKNARAIKRGNFRNLSTGVFIVVVGGYYMHELGYDKIVLAEIKKRYAEIKSSDVWRKATHKKDQAKARVVNIVEDVTGDDSSAGDA